MTTVLPFHVFNHQPVRERGTNFKCLVLVKLIWFNIEDLPSRAGSLTPHVICVIRSLDVRRYSPHRRKCGRSECSREVVTVKFWSNWNIAERSGRPPSNEQPWARRGARQYCHTLVHLFLTCGTRGEIRSQYDNSSSLGRCFFDPCRIIDGSQDRSTYAATLLRTTFCGSVYGRCARKRSGIRHYSGLA